MKHPGKMLLERPRLAQNGPVPTSTTGSAQTRLSQSSAIVRLYKNANSKGTDDQRRDEAVASGIRSIVSSAFLAAYALALYMLVYV